jgi:hypothetical protein
VQGLINEADICSAQQITRDILTRRAFAAALWLAAACSGSERAPSTETRARPAAPRGDALPAELALDGGRLELRLAGDRDPAFEARAGRWIRRSAEAVTSYYGRFPAARARLSITVFAGRGIGGGRVVMSDLPTIRISVGRYSEPDDFERDWRLTHEMVHLAFPRVDERHHWIEEGLATYVEPVARARTGWLAEEEVYAEWLDRMHLGQPRAGDRGLDRTSTWARTYWGGALFALAADVEIRARTHNRRGLRDALRGVVAGGGSIAEVWPLSRALALADRATGVAVLAEAYARAATHPAPVDLDRLWRQLGIRRDGGRIILDPAPEKAALRRAIVRGR